MYPVSDEYLTAIQDNTRSYYFEGCITTKAGIQYPFTNKDIVKGRQERLRDRQARVYLPLWK